MASNPMDIEGSRWHIDDRESISVTSGTTKSYTPTRNGIIVLRINKGDGYIALTAATGFALNAANNTGWCSIVFPAEIGKTLSISAVGEAINCYFVPLD